MKAVIRSVLKTGLLNVVKKPFKDKNNRGNSRGPFR